MSSDAKPVEVAPAVEEPAKVEDTPAPAPEVATEAKTEETAPAAVEEEKKEEEKPEPKPISEGFLEFKAPGFFQ